MGSNLKPTILIIIYHYLPGQRAGGPVRSISNLVEWLGDEFQFRIITSDHDFGTTERYSEIVLEKWQSVGKASVMYLSAQELTLRHLRRLLHETPHDLVYLDSVLAPTSIQTLLLQRLGQGTKKPVILAPRGHLAQNALKEKFFKKSLFLLGGRFLGMYRSVIWHTTSEAERQEVLTVFGQEQASRIYVIPNLPTPSAKNQVRSLPDKLSGHLRIIFLSRVAPKKNLHFALNLLHQVQGEIEFDIFGPLEDTHYWQQCEEIIGTLPAHIQVHYRGIVPFDQTGNILAQYHLFFLPTLNENFGHVILEALCAGCPVLTSDQTPWMELELYGAGWALPLLDRTRYHDVIALLVRANNSEFEQMSAKARNYGVRYIAKSGIVEQTRQFFRFALSEDQRLRLRSRTSD